jgi:hypothetical protein
LRTYEKSRETKEVPFSRGEIQTLDDFSSAAKLRHPNISILELVLKTINSLLYGLKFSFTVKTDQFLSFISFVEYFCVMSHVTKFIR